MSDHEGLLVGEALKARKRALAGLQKIHEAVARERKTIGLGPVCPSLNQSAQGIRSGGLRSWDDGSEIGGQNEIGPTINGPYEEVVDAVGSRESTNKLKQVGQSSIGSVIGHEQNRYSDGNFLPARDGIASSRSPQKFVFEKDISFGSILKTQSENSPKGIVIENGFKNNGTKSTWASLFGTSNEGSLSYTPPKAIGDKVVVVLPEEVIAQRIRVWENSLEG
ncbi:uncharacterized protein E5676_scaffold363G00760 [Cucumis melo var. makuwa]|uniref:Uncharacterized protein n=2 Tax=Cucumis melo TaxID=3656 RepID=A0A5A7TV32_CUCMM|nr:uncharacterized protein E6C27_scaffold754G00790 [Cucumis melo var. makuwa]TYK14088.1 uncharacterized protein E5676_scaffold363G00760 [Cucumis melo var. makuwa]